MKTFKLLTGAGEYRAITPYDIGNINEITEMVIDICNGLDLDTDSFTLQRTTYGYFSIIDYYDVEPCVRTQTIGYTHVRILFEPNMFRHFYMDIYKERNPIGTINNFFLRDRPFGLHFTSLTIQNFLGDDI